jgi:hypothetical protein
MDHTARLAALGLSALAGLHCTWATGSTWPFGSAEALSDKVVGRPSEPPPSPAACLGVAASLAVAAGLVAGHPRRRPGVSRAGSTGVVAVLSVRGAFGMAGRTDLLVHGSTSPAFRARDRWVYSPVCLALALLATPSTRSSVRAKRAAVRV